MKYSAEVGLITEECCACGMPFAMTSDFHRRRRADRKSFYCPSGHAQHYTGKTEEQQLREQLMAERNRSATFREKAEQVEKSYKRMRARIARGVCPCCNRTFQNLMAHMKTQHPDFSTHQTLRALRDAFGLTQSALAKEIGVPPQYVSLFERQRPVADYADQSIRRWMSDNGAA